MNDTIVISHADCKDGYASMAVMRHLLGRPFDELFLAYDQIKDSCYLEDLRHQVSGRHVYFVDFSLPRSAMDLWCDTAKSVIVIDHHASAIRELGDFAHKNLIRYLDKTQCGATLAWQVLSAAQPMPLLLRYIKAFDLFTFDMPEAREVAAGLDLAIAEVKDPVELLKANLDDENFKLVLPMLARHGETVLRVINASTAKAAKRSAQRLFQNRICHVANVVEHVSFAGEAILKAHPVAEFSMTYFGKPGSNNIIVSLRARKDSDVDVSKIAEVCGGGGHAKAAGFEIDINNPKGAGQVEALWVLGLR